MVKEISTAELKIKWQKWLKCHKCECKLNWWASSVSFHEWLYYLRNPNCWVEQNQRHNIVEEPILHQSHTKWTDIEHNIEESQSPSHIIVIIDLLMSKLRSPNNYEKSWFKCKATDKIPKCRESQVLHVFTPNWKLEVNSKEEEVPN